MKQNKIFAVIKKPGGNAEIKLIDGELKAFGDIIEGKREIIPFPGLSGVCVIFDGEGAANKKPNCYLKEYDDLLTGTVIFAAVDFETGFKSLSEMQAWAVEEYLKSNDAKAFGGNVKERITSGYLPPSEETHLYGMLCEVKTKYKTVKIKWLGKR